MLLASWQLQHRSGTLQWWFADHYIKFYLNTQHASCILNARYPHRHFAQIALTAICFCLKRIFLKVLCMTEFHQTRSFTGHLPSIDWILTFLLVSPGIRPSSWIHKHQCFRWTCCSHLQVSRLLWNTDTYPLNQTYQIPQECKIPVFCDTGWEGPNILKAHAFLVMALDCLIL